MVDKLQSSSTLTLAYGKETRNQSSYEQCGAAVQPASNGSSEPQQCQYWNTLPESGVSMVPPVYTLSNFLFVSPSISEQVNYM